MRPRHLIAALACCSVLSTGVGFAAAELSHPDNASARPDQSVTQLKNIVSELKDTNQALGSSYPGGPNVLDEIQKGLQDISHNTEETCQAVKDSFSC